MNEKTYRETMYGLFVELVKLQRHFIDCDDKILILLEGRDAAGKDGAIKRMAKHLSPRPAWWRSANRPIGTDAAGIFSVLCLISLLRENWCSSIGVGTTVQGSSG